MSEHALWKKNAEAFYHSSAYHSKDNLRLSITHIPAIASFALATLFTISAMYLALSPPSRFVSEPQPAMDEISNPILGNVSSVCPKEADRPLDCRYLGKGVAVWLSVDKPSYRPGENIIIQWTILNRGSTNATFRLSQDLKIKIFNDTGKLMWAYPSYYFDGLFGIAISVPRGIIGIPITVKAGESLSNHVVWNMERRAGACFTAGGEYRGGVLEAGLHCLTYDAGIVPPGDYTVSVSGLVEVLSQELFSVKFKVLEPLGGAGNNPVKEASCNLYPCGRYVIMKDEGNFQLGDWLELREGGIAYIDSHPRNVQGGICTAAPGKPTATWNPERAPLDPARPNEILETRLTINACGLTFECRPQAGTRPAGIGPTGQDRLSCDNFADGNSGGTWIWCEKPEALESMKKYCSSSTSAGNVIRPILPSILYVHVISEFSGKGIEEVLVQAGPLNITSDFVGKLDYSSLPRGALAYLGQCHNSLPYGAKLVDDWKAYILPNGTKVTYPECHFTGYLTNSTGWATFYPIANATYYLVTVNWIVAISDDVVPILPNQTTIITRTISIS